MRLNKGLTALALLMCSITSYATCSKETCHLFSKNRIAIQSALATGGILGIGVASFTEKTELGLTVSGSVNNSSRNQNKTITPVIFGGFRKALGQSTYFAYGLDLASTFGKTQGNTINSDYQIGPYISLEQMLTTHFMLAGWIQPYQYHYQKNSGSSTSTSTNNFFSTGGIAINYLF